MTKLKVKIEKAKQKTVTENNEGVYLATFNDINDRIVFFHCGKMIMQINVDDELIIQSNSDLTMYRNFKRIKSIDIEVELE